MFGGTFNEALFRHTGNGGYRASRFWSGSTVYDVYAVMPALRHLRACFCRCGSRVPIRLIIFMRERIAMKIVVIKAPGIFKPILKAMFKVK